MSIFEYSNLRFKEKVRRPDGFIFNVSNVSDSDLLVFSMFLDILPVSLKSCCEVRVNTLENRTFKVGILNSEKEAKSFFCESDESLKSFIKFYFERKKREKK